MAAKPKFSTTPASVIYSQSWPVPSSNSFSQRYPARLNSNSQKKSISSSWICKSKQNITRPQKVASSPAYKSYSWASSMLSNNFPGWLEDDSYEMLDMAKEFKMTLKIFKQLTEQVKEVDEQLNSGKKPYSFKHYFGKKNSRNDCHRSSMRTYTPEIPMTNESYQPCNNLGSKRGQQRVTSNQHRTKRKTVKLYNSISESKLTAWPLLGATKTDTRNLREGRNDTENGNKSQSLRFEYDDFRNETNLTYNDEDISWSSCLDFSDEDNHIGLGYIDPVPAYWEERKLEELELEFSSDKSGTDPFMHRYLQLRRMEIETVEQEKRNGKNEENVECVPCLGGNRTAISCRGKKTANCNGKKLVSKGNEVKGAFENVEKNPQRVLKTSSQSASSLPEFEKYTEKKAEKTQTNEKTLLVRETDKSRKQANIDNSEKRYVCKSAKGKRRVQSCRSRPLSHPSSATYDILELATSFDPPGKERIKVCARQVTAKSAKSKGMLPGKSWSSQRRFSLTAGQSLQNFPTDSSDPPVISKSRTSSAKKSCKKRRKRCSSAKV